MASLILLFYTQPLNSFSQGIVIQQKSVPESLKSVDCPNFAQLVNNFQERFVKKMSGWSGLNLENLPYQTVFYPFSGPDAVTVMALFPKANYFVLVADQQPEYEILEAANETTPEIQNFECQMLGRYAHSGFYLTNDLIGKNGPKPRFIKLLIYNLAFAQAQIVDIKTLFITEEGKILPNNQGKEPAGIRFELLSKEGKPISLDYIYANIADSGLKNYPQYQKAFSRKSSQIVFIKSASHLLQKPYFSILQNLLVQNAKAIIQDETGLDIALLDSKYSLQLFGKFQKPHNLWANSESAKKLANYYANHPSSDQLPFQLGYEKQAGSILMIGNRK
jgi:hypothetical protein